MPRKIPQTATKWSPTLHTSQSRQANQVNSHRQCRWKRWGSTQSFVWLLITCDWFPKDIQNLALSGSTQTDPELGAVWVKRGFFNCFFREYFLYSSLPVTFPNVMGLSLYSIFKVWCSRACITSECRLSISIWFILGGSLGSECRGDSPSQALSGSV